MGVILFNMGKLLRVMSPRLIGRGIRYDLKLYLVAVLDLQCLG
jgi:hypothetical protein